MMNREINQRNYDELVQNMRKLIENFYGDFSKEHTSFYSLLNKLNVEITNSSTLQSQVQQVKSHQPTNRLPV